jgi:hypothetical protein
MNSSNSNYRQVKELEKLQQMEALYSKVEGFIKSECNPSLIREQCLFRLLESQLILREMLKGLGDEL